MNNNNIVLYVCIGVIIVSAGFIFGVLYQRNNCTQREEILWESCLDVILSVSDIDTDKVLRSVEYCELINNNSLFTNLTESSGDELQDEN